MAVRFDPTTRTLWLSIRDLVDTTAFPGSVSLTPALRSRAAMGREVHTVRQAAQQETVPSYRAEVTVRQQLLVDDYTVHLQGRIDGLYEEDGTLIVEEIKSLLVPPEHFHAITLGAYPAYEQQLTLYVHLLRQQHSERRNNAATPSVSRSGRLYLRSRKTGKEIEFVAKKEVENERNAEHRRQKSLARRQLRDKRQAEANAAEERRRNEEKEVKVAVEQEEQRLLGASTSFGSFSFGSTPRPPPASSFRRPPVLRMYGGILPGSDSRT